MPPVAVITGASRGLGLALASELAQQGWQLVIDARGADALSQASAALAAHTQVRAIAGDIADPAHQSALAQAAQLFGGIDALFLSASTLGPSPMPAALDLSPDALAALLQTNVCAQLAVLQALWPQLAPAAPIFAISSDAAVEPYAGWGGYGASKAALEQLFAVLAAERPERRIYVVDPGDMRTQMHQDAFPGEDIGDRPPPEASVPGLLALLGGGLPSGRYQARSLPVEASR
ncbi:SDR family oxidoreductase [Chloroflexia bacterium SDU3-3]|nr:SDR family oxidoreductase [Chloroflexia bacterium SDU3-3]